MYSLFCFFLRFKLRPSLRSSRTLYPCSTCSVAPLCIAPITRTALHSTALPHHSRALPLTACCHISQPCCALWHLHSLVLLSSSPTSQFVLSVLPIVLALPRQSRTLPQQSRMAVSATLWHSLSHIVAPSQTIKGQSLPPVFPQFLAGFNLSNLQLNPSIPLRVAFLHKLCSWLRRNNHGPTKHFLRNLLLRNHSSCVFLTFCETLFLSGVVCRSVCAFWARYQTLPTRGLGIFVIPTLPWFYTLDEYLNNHHFMPPNGHGECKFNVTVD